MHADLTLGGRRSLPSFVCGGSSRRSVPGSVRSTAASSPSRLRPLKHEQTQSAGATPLSGLRILVVEDETMLFFLAEDMLTELGCSAILHACRVKDALALLARERPDDAMLDVNLAGEQAYPIAERLAEVNVPFVFATGYGSRGIPPNWASRPVVQKPFTLDMLAKAMTATLAPAPAKTSGGQSVPRGSGANAPVRHGHMRCRRVLDAGTAHTRARRVAPYPPLRRRQMELHHPPLGIAVCR